MTSYVGFSSCGDENIVLEAVNAEEIEGQNILIVEDMIDSGLTMKKFYDSIEMCKPKSLKIALLLYKKNTVDFIFSQKT